MVGQESVQIIPALSINCARVAAGSFIMGSDGNPESLPGEIASMQEAKYDFSLEAPKHEVLLDDFLISRAPITRGQYEHFRNATAADSPRTINSAFTSEGPNVALGGVTWLQATAFCNWASSESGLNITLPSEAQWEKAARGADGRHYPWGDDPPTKDHCHYAAIGSAPREVGQKSPLGDSPYGCMDMIGNVGEWCSSIFARYPYNPSDGREEQAHEGPTWRVVRGTPTQLGGKLLRCAARFSHLETVNPIFVGFRIVVNA